VVTLSTQTYGADLVTELRPRALLLVHGTADTVLPDRCSRDLYALAAEPKELVLYDGAGHGLTEAAAPLRALLEDRLARLLTPGAERGLRCEGTGNRDQKYAVHSNVPITHHVSRFTFHASRFPPAACMV
jgi:hypothetical protein